MVGEKGDEPTRNTHSQLLALSMIDDDLYPKKKKRKQKKAYECDVARVTIDDVNQDNDANMMSLLVKAVQV